MKKLFCRHKDLQLIYRNERPTKDLYHIENYGVYVCKKCKKRILKVSGISRFKAIKLK